MSIVCLNSIKEYWSSSPLLEQEFFSFLMSRRHFQSVRARLTFHPSTYGGVEERKKDPFWDMRFLMRKLQQRMTETATVEGITSFDEMGIQKSGMHRGITYNPLKPNKFCFQLYAEADTSTLYVQNVQVNDRGVYPKNSVGRFCEQHPRLGMPLHRVVQWLKSQDQPVLINDHCIARIKPFVARGEHRRPATVLCPTQTGDCKR